MADNNQEEFPSVEKQIGNLAKFAIEMVTDIATTHDLDVFASQDLQKERMDICNQCEHFAYRQKRCKKCGCWMEHKVKFTASECPDDRW